MVKTKEEVEQFLELIKCALKQSYQNLTIIKKTKGEDKTREFMIENNIRHERICGELIKLDVSNYSYTEKDDNKNWQGEVWIFGQIMEVRHNQMEEIYIKLKIRNSIICMSFHVKEFDLKYPYN